METVTIDKMQYQELLNSAKAIDRRFLLSQDITYGDLQRLRDIVNELDPSHADWRRKKQNDMVSKRANELRGKAYSGV